MFFFLVNQRKKVRKEEKLPHEEGKKICNQFKLAIWKSYGVKEKQ